jgi:alcohol dehydrogenase class IV
VRGLRFEFATAGRILFGAGTAAEAPALAAGLGRRAFAVCDAHIPRDGLLDGLQAHGLAVGLWLVEQEPQVADVLRAVQAFKAAGCDLVLGLGGGSAIDTGKAVAGLAANPGEPLDYLEVVGAGKPLEKPSVPYIAIPTTAGTGAECTRNAVLAVPEKQVKVSLRSPFLLPRIAVVDPELTLSLPPEITASTGMDALTQVVEPFVCNAPTPLTDALCRDGLARAGQALRRAYANGQDLAARAEMSLVSLYGGLALANARLGAVHGLAGPLGGLLQAPHGAVCARLLPLVMRANIEALRSRQPRSITLERYEDVARLLTGIPAARAEDGVEYVERLCAELHILPLGEFGLQAVHLPTIVQQAQQSSSMKGNPIQLTDAELAAILAAAM